MPVLVVAGFALLPAGARGDDSAVRKALEAQYSRMNGAIAMQDANAFFAPLTTDFTISEGGRTVSRAQYEQSWRGLFGHLRGHGMIAVKIVKLRTSGKQAVAETHPTATFSLEDPLGSMGPKGRTHNLVLDMRERDTWVQQGGEWLLKHTDVLPGSRQTLDGKPLVHRRAGPTKAKR